MHGRDYYEVLGVPRDATDAQIRKRYRFLAMAFHPDRYPESRKQDAARQMAEVNEAYSVLGDPVRRAEYDREAARKSEGSGTTGHHAAEAAEQERRREERRRQAAEEARKAEAAARAEREAAAKQQAAREAAARQQAQKAEAARQQAAREAAARRTAAGWRLLIVCLALIGVMAYAVAIRERPAQSENSATSASGLNATGVEREEEQSETPRVQERSSVAMANGLTTSSVSGGGARYGAYESLVFSEADSGHLLHVKVNSRGHSMRVELWQGRIAASDHAWWVSHPQEAVSTGSGEHPRTEVNPELRWTIKPGTYTVFFACYGQRGVEPFDISYRVEVR